MGLRDTEENSLEELEFLARSPNRVAVLRELTDGPVGRYDLEEAADVTRATLGRVLDNFEDRGWVVEVDRTYEATQLGAYVDRVFGDALAGFEPVPALEEVAEWFPGGGFEFDLGCLAGAQVVRPTRSDALAPTTHIARRLREADRVRLVTYSVLPSVMEACWRGTVDGSLELESILDGGAIESFGADPDMVDRALELFETGRAEIVLYEGEVPTTLFVVDDSVLLCLSGGEGAPRAVIETEDETIRSWAEATIDEYREDGELVDPSLFTG